VKGRKIRNVLVNADGRKTNLKSPNTRVFPPTVESPLSNDCSSSEADDGEVGGQ